MSHDGVGPRAVKRSVAFLTAGALAVPLLAGCSSDEEVSKPLAGPDVAPAARNLVADGGTLRWAVDAMPETLNTFQADADAGTTRIAQAVLPSMFRLDANGRPQRDADYLETARVVQTEPKQVVVYRLNQRAVWSDGREIGAADFAAQWRALSGKDAAYWTARNAGYDRIEKVERGANDLEVRVTFGRPYADWRSLFSPLYPKDVTGTPDTFNDGARKKLAVTAGPFAVQKIDTAAKDVVLARNPRWWGHRAKLSQIVLHTVPRDQRATALAAGTVDVADVDPAEADRITSAAARGGSAFGGAARGRTAAKAPRSWALVHGTDEKAARRERTSLTTYLREQEQLRDVQLRKSLDPAYTQLALNGADGPLADERVRHAVARALDRGELAALALKPLGLPTTPVGSHLALSGQDAYADGSGALGGQDTEQARALLADAGWVPGPVKAEKKGDKAAGPTGHAAHDASPGGNDGTYIVGRDDNVEDNKVDDNKPPARTTGLEGADREAKPGRQEGADGHAGQGGAQQLAQDGRRYARQHLTQGGAPGAYAPKGTAAPAGAAGPLAKDGKPLTLRFVLPSGPGSETLRKVADRISAMLGKVGISTDITKVPDAGYFKDHIAAGQYDLALYSWPASAFPATDARPIYAKPVPAADGSLNVQQNYTRVGTDQVDQLFDQAIATLDEGEMRGLVRKADSRIWAEAGSIPLYQRPQLVAVRKNLANVGAFGFRTPVYEDMGFLRKGAKPSPSPSASPSS
ncbi:ABC transporter family substrate-binding protein [Streptomyces tropicalis]|uniref:ABC transporter family substrate-binding protein n=1 Tax=Streptomyces tropicalis TaxID=3034234 RepID=A0ABT6A0B6_9ACTN|nr:ABC transporter family substrate-binding protein [Streptomyces tropicalis]MDF3298080.1 ABC transporter family substrate-binding protein [Streptomyces tropicalis]